VAGTDGIDEDETAFTPGFDDNHNNFEDENYDIEAANSFFGFGIDENCENDQVDRGNNQSEESRGDRVASTAHAENDTHGDDIFDIYSEPLIDEVITEGWFDWPPPGQLQEQLQVEQRLPAPMYIESSGEEDDTPGLASIGNSIGSAPVSRLAGGPSTTSGAFCHENHKQNESQSIESSGEEDDTPGLASIGNSIGSAPASKLAGGPSTTSGAFCHEDHKQNESQSSVGFTHANMSSSQHTTCNAVVPHLQTSLEQHDEQHDSTTDDINSQEWVDALQHELDNISTHHEFKPQWPLQCTFIGASDRKHMTPAQSNRHNTSHSSSHDPNLDATTSSSSSPPGELGQGSRSTGLTRVPALGGGVEGLSPPFKGSSNIDNRTAYETTKMSSIAARIAHNLKAQSISAHHLATSKYVAKHFGGRFGKGSSGSSRE
jgi:hypothetical protein